MDTPQTPENPAQTPVKRTRKRIISPRVRHAIKLRVENRLSGEDAARAAGLSPSGFWKAMTQPHIIAYAQEAKAAYIAKAIEKRELLKAHAMDVAEELLGKDQPPAVRARMVEFLAAEERKNPAVAVQINVDRGGYEYARPGAQIVEILPGAGPATGGAGGAATDTGSGDDEG